MANLYTRKGDQGETCLVGGMRVEKDNPRVQCYGTIDEVNSILGLAYASCDHEDINEYIKTIQQKLFVFGAELASDKNAVESLKDKITNQDIDDLEHLIDKCTETIGIQKEFVIPGVNQASASLHMARTIVRKAEREIITLNRSEEIRSVLICYANRLSDALYALARLEEDYVKYEIIKQKVIEIVRKRIGMENKNFNLEFAKKLAVLVEQKAKEINVPCVFTAVDTGGNIILHERMDGALLGSLDISKNKAYTAVAFKMPTSALAKEALPGGNLYGIQNTNDNKTVIFGGGYPYKINGEVVGGIGISGGTVEEDMIIAEYALKNIGGNM